MTTVGDHTKDVRGKLVTHLDASNEVVADNPIGVIRRRYEDIRAKRDPFMREAKTMAELVIPGMYDDEMGACGFGSDKFLTANQSLIMRGTRMMAWSMATVILPINADNFSRTIDESVAQQLQQLDQLQELSAQGDGLSGPNFTPISVQYNQEFLRDDNIVKRKIQSSNHQETLARCFFHTLIGGISVFAHLNEREAKTYTIQNSAVVFDSAYNPVEVIVEDWLPLVELPIEVRTKLIGSKDITNLPSDQQFVHVLTQQLRTPKGYSIKTEIEGIPIRSEGFEWDSPPHVTPLIPLPFEFVNGKDPFPVGWLTLNRGDLNSFEDLSMAMESMTHAAKVIILAMTPGSRVTQEELEKAWGLFVIPSGDDPKAINMLAAPIAQNLQQMAGLLDAKKRDIQLAFGMDFAIQRPGERVTAEEIQTLREGLQKLQGSTFKQSERTFQSRHIRNQFYYLEQKGLVRKIDEDTFDLTLTAGLQATEAQNEIMKMDQVLARSAQLEQAPGPFSKDATLRWYATKFKLDVTDKLLNPEQQAEQLGIGQLLTMVRQLGPQGPSIVANMLSNLMQQGSAGTTSGGGLESIGGPSVPSQ